MSTEERLSEIRKAIFDGELNEAKDAIKQAVEDDINPALILRKRG